MTDWQEALREQRAAKDEYFRTNPHSPLPADERETFDGLSYYPIDPAYRFEIALDSADEPERITVATSTDGEQDYHRVGTFRFTVEGTDCTLGAYRASLDEQRLWVPFRDATSGEDTYGAGRYLDLEPDRHRTADGNWILDFNEAYNPTCAYADQYECPLPPVENWLEVPIRAGERTPD